MKSIPEFTPRQLRDDISLYFPRRIHIEPTNACNLHCVMCPRNFSDKKIGFMSLNIFKKIIDECKDYPLLRSIDLQKDGEPLLHKKLFDFIDYAKKSDVCQILRFSTNGTLLSSEVSKKLVDKELDMITIGLDGIGPETYCMLRKGSNYNLVRNNIYGLMDAKRKAGSDKPYVRVQIIKMRQTEGEIARFHRQWQGVVDEVKIQQFISWQGYLLTRKQRNSINRKSRFPCIFLWQQLIFNWDGTISICPVDFQLKGSIGNVKTQSMKTTWDSRRMQNFRIDHLIGSYRMVPCKECVDWRCIRPARRMWTDGIKNRFLAHSKRLLK